MPNGLPGKDVFLYLYLPGNLGNNIGWSPHSSPCFCCCCCERSLRGRRSEVGLRNGGIATHIHNSINAKTRLTSSLSSIQLQPKPLLSYHEDYVVQELFKKETLLVEVEEDNTTHEPSPSDKSFTFRGGVFIMPYLSLTERGLRLLILLTICYVSSI